MLLPLVSKILSKIRWPYLGPWRWEGRCGSSPRDPSHISQGPPSHWKPSGKAHLEEPVSSGMLQARLGGQGTVKAKMSASE